MVLELDCGNSLIKWRVLGRGTTVVAAGVVDSIEALKLEIAGVGRVRAARMVSVRSDDETAGLCASVTACTGVEVLLAQPAGELAGVINGYRDFTRLGMDRWLALVAAWNLVRGPVLILDLGTAVTADLVDAHGRHLGGYIGPGLALMRRSLLSHTSRIRYELQEATDAVAIPGRETREAVERGCRSMLEGFVIAQLQHAQDILGEDCHVFLTGGDAGLAQAVIPQAEHVADLVFSGLAIACPLGVEEGCD